MSANEGERQRDSTRVVLEPSTFSPPREMRETYLNNHKAELDQMGYAARAGEWKSVMNIANHVRGTGAMYGFPAMGDAAENLVKAVENGYANSLDYLDEYIRIVKDTTV